MTAVSPQVAAGVEVLRVEVAVEPVLAVVERMPAAEGAGRVLEEVGVEVLRVEVAVGPVPAAVEHVPVVEARAVGRVLAEAAEGVRRESQAVAAVEVLEAEAVELVLAVVEHVLVAVVAGTDRRSVAARRSVIRTQARELGAVLRASLEILPRASVRGLVFARGARRQVCDKGAARRWEPGISVAGPGSAAERWARSPDPEWSPEGGVASAA